MGDVIRLWLCDSAVAPHVVSEMGHSSGLIEVIDVWPANGGVMIKFRGSYPCVENDLKKEFGNALQLDTDRTTYRSGEIKLERN